MIISIDKYKKTGGSSGGSNTGGNTGSNASTYYIPDDIQGIHNIMFENRSNNVEGFAREVKNSIISNGFAKVTNTTLLLPEPYPKLVYTSNGWQEVIDANGNMLQTCVLPDDFFDYQEKIHQNSFSKQEVIDACLNYNKTYPNYDLFDQVFCNYDLENQYSNVSPYIKTITYATTNDYIPYHNNVGYHFNTYYGPEDRYFISLDTIYCVAEYDANKCFNSEGKIETNSNGISYQDDFFQCYKYSSLNKYGDETDADCYLIKLRSYDDLAYKDGKYICTTRSVSRSSRYNYFRIKKVNKCALFVDTDKGEIVNPTLKFIDGWSSDGYIGDLPYAYYNLEIEGGNYISFNGYSNAIFGKGLKNFTLTLNSNTTSTSLYSYNHFTNASDLETITINFDETVPETVSSDFYFDRFFTNDSVTKITFNCPHKIKFTNSEYSYSLKFNCKKLKDIKGLELFSVNARARDMFSGCSSLTSIPALDTSNVTSVEGMFSGCSSLTSIPALDTSNVTSVEGMFHGCSSLTSIPQLDTSNVKYMSSMFYGCSSLTSIPALNTSNVTEMGSMFQNCSSLTSIPVLNTSNVTYMGNMFYDCSSLTSIPALDTSNVTSMGSMFGYSKINTLTDLGGFKNLSISITSYFLDMCPNLTVESLMNVINNLATVSGKSLKFGSTNLNKLTAEQIAIATAKGWTLTA